MMMAGTNEAAITLLKAGADIDPKDEKGNTALVYAGIHGLKMAAFLILKLRYHHDKNYKKFLVQESYQKPEEFIYPSAAMDMWWNFD